MQSLSNRINGIFDKVKDLGSKLERIQNENRMLDKENKQIKSELKQANERLIALEEEFSNTSKALVTEKRNGNTISKELKKEIDQYMHAIDQCIDWLHNN